MKTFKFVGIFIVSIMVGVLFFAGTASAQTSSEVTWYGYNPSTWTTPFQGTTYAYPGGITAFYAIDPNDIMAGSVQYTIPVTTIRIKEICDENGQHCKTVATGLGAANSLATPDGSQTNVVYVNSSANVGVGTTNPQSKLAVNGTIMAKEVKVTQSGWSDFVFAQDYRLLPLDELETYVGTEKHLPGIPSAQEVKEKGLAIADTLSKQMQKIEELTLYLIQLKKENEQLKERITALEKGK